MCSACQSSVGISDAVIYANVSYIEEDRAQSLPTTRSAEPKNPASSRQLQTRSVVLLRVQLVQLWAKPWLLLKHAHVKIWKSCRKNIRSPNEATVYVPYALIKIDACRHKRNLIIGQTVGCECACVLLHLLQNQCLIVEVSWSWHQLARAWLLSHGQGFDSLGLPQEF